MEEAEEILSQQTDYLTRLARQNDEQKDALEEHKWDVLQKEKKLEETRLFANQLINEAKVAVRAKESQREDIDIQYRECVLFHGESVFYVLTYIWMARYKQAIDLYNRVLFGAKSIDFSSMDVIHVTFEDKYKGAVLHIYIDYEAKKVVHLVVSIITVRALL